MVEPALVADDAGGVGPLRPLEEGVQRGQHARDALGPRDPPVVNPDADGRQSETHRRDAAGRAGRTAVGDQPVGRIGPVPEIVETGLLDVFQEFVVAGKGMGSVASGAEGALSCELALTAVT